MQIYLPQVKAEKGEAVDYLFSDFKAACPDSFCDADLLEVRVSASWSAEQVLISGSLDASTETVCSRCLVLFRHVFGTEFTETFKIENSEPRQGTPADMAVEAAEKLTVCGEYLYLDEYVRQLVILARDYSPLCNADCRGICAGCGADLNREPCTCGAGEMKVDVRFLKLNELKSGGNTR